MQCAHVVEIELRPGHSELSVGDRQRDRTTIAMIDDMWIHIEWKEVQHRVKRIVGIWTSLKPDLVRTFKSLTVLYKKFLSWLLGVLKLIYESYHNTSKFFPKIPLSKN